MISEHQSEVHEKVLEYLNEQISFADVQNWLWPFLANLDDQNDCEARNTAGVIGSLISEYSSGGRTEDSMKKALAEAVRPLERAGLGSVVFLRHGNSGSNSNNVSKSYAVVTASNNIGFNSAAA